MIIPKEHSRWLWDLKEEDYVYLIKKTKTIAQALRKSFKTDWVQEIVAGMGIEHTHIHLIPRKEKDNLGEIPTKIINPIPSEKELKKIAETIKSFLN